MGQRCSWTTRGEVEARFVMDHGHIPNVGRSGQVRPMYVTTDAPTDSATASELRYELAQKPTHGVTVPADRVGPLGPTPDGRPTTSGGGSEAATNEKIPASPHEVQELGP